MSRKRNPVLGMKLRGAAALDAGAGTGKTYSIALIHLRLILAGVPVEKILVTTFTEDAAAELRERLRRRLAEARAGLAGEAAADEDLQAVLDNAKVEERPAVLCSRIDAALACFDLAPVCTIHGFCHRLLQAHALELGADPDSDILADDPRLQRLVDDSLARLAGASGGGPEENRAPDARDLLHIARKIREYALPAPAPVQQETLRRQAEQQARDIARQRLREAARAWREQREAIQRSLRGLILDGRIRPGEFDRPDGNENQRWRKLTASMEDAGALLADPDAQDLTFSAGAKRLLPAELMKSAAPGAARDIRALLDRHTFFGLWDLVGEVPGLLAARLQTADIRFYEDDVLQRVAQLPPDRHVIFADLINGVFRHLDRDSFTAMVRNDFSAALVDECQDTDARQIAIFHKLFAAPQWLDAGGGRCLIWVGDPKQSIYRFRGADIETYLRARKDANQDLTLQINYRSDPPAVAAVNALFRHPDQSGASVFHKDIPFVPAQSSQGVRLRVAGSKQAPPAFCLHTWEADDQPPAKTAALHPALQDAARHIAQLLRSGLELETEDGTWRPLRAGDMAVLAARHRDLETVRRNLLQEGIPSAYRTDSSVFLEDEARDTSLLLRALASPHPAALRSALATPFFGYSLGEVARLDDANLLAGHQERLSRLAERLAREGFLAVLFALLRDPPTAAGREKTLVRLAGQPDGERILTNLIQLGELLQGAWMERHARSAAALKDYLDQAIASARANEHPEAEDTARLRLETDAPAVILSTLHAAKGLQYPLVFLPTLWTSRSFRAPPCIVQHAADGAAKLILPDAAAWDEALEQERRELEAEQMRLVYVAVTRAKHQIHAWWGRVGGTAAPSAFERLMFGGSGAPAGCSDAECRAAFRAAMERDPSATYEIVELGEIPAWARSPAAPARRERAGNPPVPASVPAPWTRAALPADPLPSSYSALLRRHQEEHRADDEVEVAAIEPEETAPSPAAPSAPVADVLEPFQAGRALGDRIHQALEAALSADKEDEAERRLVDDLLPDTPGLLRQAGPDRETDTETTARLETRLRELWRRTAGARLGPEPFGLGALLAQPHTAEWTFLLPQQSAWNPRGLADILRAHGGDSPWGKAEYADRVRELGFPSLQGYFEGIIDVLGQLPNQRWILADYKTNRLDGYDDALLERAMADSHYLLQALLYAVAARRWLQRTVHGWSYDLNFAGIAYLFLRGMAAGTARGVWWAKPPAGLVEAVDRLLCGGSP